MDMNMSSLFFIREILDFSNKNNSTYVEGNNTYWYMKINQLCQKKLTNWQTGTYYILIFVGALTVVSGFIDYYASYNIPGSFKKMTIEGFNFRIKNNKSIKNKDLDIFLTYAYGEFMDLYQKRGSFNREKFVSGLLKW